MNENISLTLFYENKIRKQKINDEWFYSIVDIISILLIQPDNQKSRKYWNKLNERLRTHEHSELVTNCHQLKMKSVDENIEPSQKNRTVVITILKLF